MTIILCGLPMSGKSTIGKILAEKLDYTFVDTDGLIEEQYAQLYGKNLSFRQIYQEKGEKFFRELEKKCILSLQQEPMVIALGGGSLLDDENRLFLKDKGKIYFLKLSPGQLVQRIQQRGMPAYLVNEDPQKKLEEMALKRVPIYESVADKIIDIENLNKEEIVQQILRHRNNHGL